MSEFKASLFLSAASHLVGEDCFLADTFPVDHTKGIARYLRSGFVERDTSKFDAALWGTRRIGVDVIETPLKTIAATDNGAGIIIAIAQGVIGAGVIMRSVDDCKTWSIITPSVGATYETLTYSVKRSAICFIDGYFYLGVKTGPGSSTAGIMRSADGLTWEVVSSGIPSTNSNAVCGFAKIGTTLFAVASGPQGTILKSTDGGANWTVARQTSSFIYENIKAVGPLLLVVGKSGSGVGVVTSSTDLGATWFDTSSSYQESVFHDATGTYNPVDETVTVAAVGIAGTAPIFMRRTEHPLATFASTLSWGNSSVGASINNAITSVEIDPDGGNYLYCQNITANGVMESYQFTGVYTQRFGNTPYGIVKLQSSAKWTYAIAGSVTDKGFCRFRNKVAAAGIFPEQKRGSTYQYVRVS